MKAQLLNDLGCVIGHISEPTNEEGLNKISSEWLPLLNEGDTIKIVSMDD